jgi:hypothetical protein
MLIAYRSAARGRKRRRQPCAGTEELSRRSSSQIAQFTLFLRAALSIDGAGEDEIDEN